MGLRVHRIAVLAVVLAAAIGPSQAPAQSGGLTFVGVPSQPVTLAADDEGARIRLLLRNGSERSGELRIRFVGADGRVVSAGDRTRRALRLDLLPGTRTRIAPRALRRIGVRLVPRARYEIPSGTLLVQLAGSPAVEPASVALQPSSAAPARKATFYQSAIEVTVTRGRWFGLGDDEPDVEVPLLTAPADTARIAAAKLLSGEGEPLTATLGPAKDGRADLSIVDYAGAGKYVGNLRSAGQRSDDLELTVHVQDWFVYPLAVLIAGVVAGGAGQRLFERWRQWRVMQRQIGDAREAWSRTPPPDALKGFDFEAASQGPLRALRRNWWRLRSVDEFADAVAAAEAFVALAGRWTQLADALQRLKRALEKLKEHGDGHPARRGTPRGDTEAMLVETYGADDPGEASAAVERIAGQARIVEHYTRARELGCDVADDYEAAGPEVYRTRRATRQLIDLLARRVRHLEGDADLQWETASPDRKRFAVSHLAPELGVADRTEAPPEELPEELPAPEVVVRSIRRWDAAAFALQSTAIGAAYMLTLYQGKDFGGWENYLSAFAAGFAGTVAIPWQLLFRGTRPSATPATE